MSVVLLLRVGPPLPTDHNFLKLKTANEGVGKVTNLLIKVW